MTSDLTLPPVFTPIRVEPSVSAGDQAMAMLARSRLADGTIFWRDHGAQLDCALVLEADESQAGLAQDLRMAGEVALTDALGALLPPQLPVQTVIGGVAVDGTQLGSLSVDGHPDRAECLLLHIHLPLGPGEIDGLSLADLGGGLLEQRLLLAALARQLIHWVGVLEDDGTAAIAKAWRARQLRETLSDFGNQPLLDRPGGSA